MNWIYVENSESEFKNKKDFCDFIAADFEGWTSHRKQKKKKSL